jgi:hypothetical protein
LFTEGNSLFEYGWQPKDARYQVGRVTPEQDAAYMAAVNTGKKHVAASIVRKALGIEFVSSAIDRDGAHSPAEPESGSPAYNVTENGTYPDDVYSSNGLKYYGTGEAAFDREAYRLLDHLRGHPDRFVTVYRAIRSDSQDRGIQPGAWVTTVRPYAVAHGKAALNGEYRVQSKRVRAKDIFTAGDSWLEWGYHPQPQGTWQKPIVRDDAGNAITLSQRFNKQSVNARYQVGKTRIHRTVPRLQSSVEYQAALTDAEKDPAAYYEQQLLAKTMQQFQEKAPEDLLNLPDAVQAFKLGEVDSASNFGPLAIAAAMEKYRAAGNTAKVRELALKLSRSAGVAAQMVRQMAALPGMAPQRIVDAIKDQTEAMGESLSESTLTTVYNLAEADITARQEMIEAERKFANQPTDANETKLRDATKKADQANRKVLRKVSEVTPRTWGNLIKTIMQGNVMTPVSIVANTTGNTVNLPMRWCRQTVAALTEQLLHGLGFVKTRSVTGPHVVAWARGLGQGAKAVPSILWNGIPPAALRPGGEVHRGFQPARALIRALTEHGRPGKAWTYGTLPAEPGPTLNQRAKLLVEGTIGSPAELAFRLLSATDVPFYQAAYVEALEEIGELRGYGKARMKQWTKAPDAEAKALAEERAAVAVYQGKSGKFGNALQQLANWTPGFDPKENPEMADLMNALFVRPYALFVRTPIQIVKEANAFLNPLAGTRGIVSNIRKAQQAKARGDIAGMQRAQHDALISWGGMVTGTIMWSVAYAMVRAGLAASPFGSDEERDLGRLRLKPGHFNWSGLKRLLRGQDPSLIPGDVQLSYLPMGMPGLTLNVASSGAQILSDKARQFNHPFDQASIGFWDFTSTLPSTLPSAMLDMTMIKGAGMLLAGFERKTPQEAFIQLFEAITAVPMPNTLKAASRVVLKDMPDTEAESRYDESMWKSRSMGREMVNRLETKLHIMRWAAAKAAGRPVPLRVEDVPLRLDLLGRPVPMTPAGRNSIVYHLIDTPKASQIQAEPIIQEIDRVFRATNRLDVIPNRPSGKINNPRTGQPIRLTKQQIQRWTEIHGLLTQWVIAAAIRQPDWPAATPDQQAEYLATLNGRVSTLSRIEMLRELGILPRY